jgi:hypothetical protein
VDVLIGGDAKARVHAELAGEDRGEIRGVLSGGVVLVVIRGEQRRIGPDRLAIRAPIACTASHCASV